MRAIKFRAWDKDDRRMYPCSGPWRGNVVLSLELGVFRAQPEEELEIMQFTGLKDKNGLEVYEGDIVSTSDNGGDTDRWSNADWGCQRVTIDEHGVHFGNWNWDDPDSVTDIQYIEVIGNIYENPELLK